MIATFTVCDTLVIRKRTLGIEFLKDILCRIRTDLFEKITKQSAVYIYAFKFGIAR